MYNPYGTFPPAPMKWIPQVEPASFLDYTENVADAITNPFTKTVDPLRSLSLTIQPSGAGELVASMLTVDPTGFLVTWWLTGGVPGREYLINLVGTTLAGRVYQWLFGVNVDPIFATNPIPPSPNPGFGPAITWFFAPAPPFPALFFDNKLNFGAWPFGLGYVGPPTPVVLPVEPFPSLFFNDNRNFGAWPFGLGYVGPPVPYNPPVVIPHPSLIFEIPINFGAWPFGMEYVGPPAPVGGGAPFPALFFDSALNFGAWPFGLGYVGPPSGAPTIGSMTGTFIGSSTFSGSLVNTGNMTPIPSLIFDTPVNFGAWPFGLSLA